MDGYEGLRVWPLALEMCRVAYELADRLPPSEQRGLKDQMRRSSQSACSNLVEGKSSATPRRYAASVSIARAEANELRAQIQIAVAVGYLTDAEAAPALQLADNVSKMLWSLHRSLLNNE